MKIRKILKNNLMRKRLKEYSEKKVEGSVASFNFYILVFAIVISYNAVSLGMIESLLILSVALILPFAVFNMKQADSLEERDRVNGYD